MKVRAKENFHSDDYFEVTVAEQFTGSQKRGDHYSFVIPVHKNYLNQLVTIYGYLNCEILLCSKQHEHPYVYLNDELIEGMCYYAKDIDEKIVFVTIKEKTIYKRITTDRNTNSELKELLIGNA